MKTKYTPKGWHVKVHDKGPYFSEVEIWHENYGLLARMPDNSSIWNSEKKEDVALEALNQNITNAKLIAAAPELLEACEKAFIHLDVAGIEKGLQYDLKAAIEKATS